MSVNMNDPPVFVDLPADMSLQHGEKLIFEVLAEDPQFGTELVYSIHSQPGSDIEIDPTTGMIEWTGSILWFEVPPFIFNVTVQVSDGRNNISGSFLIEMTYDGLPTTEIGYPINGTKVPFNGFEIQWTCSKTGSASIDYDIFLHEKKAFVQARRDTALHVTVSDVNAFLLKDLKVGDTYYWSVVPKEDGMRGFCLDGIYSFTVNSPPYLMDDTYFVVNTGEEFHKLLSVLDNDTFDGSNLSFELLEGPKGLTVHNRTGAVDWTPNGDQARMHHVKIQVTDGADTIMLTLVFDVKGEGSGEAPFFLIFLGSIIVVFAILAFIIINVLRKKIKEQDKEEQRIMSGKFLDDDDDDTKVEKYKCDVPLTSAEAHSHLQRGSKEVSYEDLYGNKPPEKGEG
jgi:hypothetical protein